MVKCRELPDIYLEVESRLSLGGKLEAFIAKPLCNTKMSVSFVIEVIERKFKAQNHAP